MFLVLVCILCPIGLFCLWLGSQGVLRFFVQELSYLDILTCSAPMCACLLDRLLESKYMLI